MASRRVPSPTSVGDQAALFVNVLRPSSEEIQLHVELLDDIHEFIENDYGRISVRTVAYRFTLPRTCTRKAIRCLRLRPLVIGTVLHLKDRHVRDRRKFVEEMLARRLDLNGASRGRSQRVDGRIST